jgi:hypothetical protein
MAYMECRIVKSQIRHMMMNQEVEDNSNRRKRARGFQ